jgi:hypothetical protein
MYAPQYPIQPRKTDTPTPHVHPPETSLKDHEDNEQFKVYLTGRDSAYEHAVRNIQTWITQTKETQARNPHDSALWALTEGQLEGLKEILHVVENTRELGQ